MENFTNNFSELQDFNFEPNPKVWKEVEKQLPKEKKRRVIFWWWLLPSLILVGLGTWFAANNLINKNIFAKNDFDESKNEIKRSEIKGNVNSEKNITTKVSENNLQEKTKEIFEQNKLNEVKNKVEERDTEVEKNKSKNELVGNKVFAINTKNSVSKTSIDKKSFQASKAINYKENNEDLAKDIFPVTERSTEQSTTKNIDNELTESKIVEQKKSIKTVIKEKETKKEISKNNVDIKLPKKKLEFSLKTTTGVNYTSNKTLFGTTNESQIKTLANIGPGTGTGSGLGSNPQPNNDPTLKLPQTGFIVGLGVEANYKFSKKSSVSFGLNYLYQQNNFIVEQIAQSTLNSPVDLYQNGKETYKTNYQIISLPVNFKYCLNPTSSNKLSILAGFSFDYAIANKNLFINKEKAVYEINSNELNSFLIAPQLGIEYNFKNKFHIDLLAKKYFTSVQKSSQEYYWQQVLLQVGIPIK